MSQTVKSNETEKGRFPAFFAELLRSRSALRGMMIVAGAQIGLVAWGLPALPCPLRHGFGIACPGCGLTRAVVALLHGDWRLALAYHAFAPLVAVALALVLVAAFAPAKTNRRLALWVEKAERRSGLTALLGVAFFAYWLARLLLFPTSLALVLNS
jgi:cytochrome bd-type quinol oxidase subunit 2